MSSTKVPPPRKLEDKEDLDSFEDFWFQVETYYGRDSRFATFISDPTIRWQGVSVLNRGLEDIISATDNRTVVEAAATRAANLNTLLRALATYALGPYIKRNILEKSTSLQEVKKEFMKLLEINLSDSTFLNFYDIKRKVNERPLMFYHRLKYHVERHLLTVGDVVNGGQLTENEAMCPTLERLVIMEWLCHIDERLIKFVQEKFSTELCRDSSSLLTLVESLARNMDTYLADLNRGLAVQSVTNLPKPPVTIASIEEDYWNGDLENTDTDVPACVREVNLSGRGFRGYNRTRGYKPSSRGVNNRTQQSRSQQQSFGSSFSYPRQSGGPVCEYCYLQVKTRKSPFLDYHHEIRHCQQVLRMQTNRSVNFAGCNEDSHPFDQFVSDFDDCSLDERQ